MKAWQGRFSEGNHELMEAFNASIGFDYKLCEVDIIGSMAHVKMLASIDVITEEEMNTLVAGLQEVLEDFKADKITFKLSDEDIHMGIERILIEKLGSVAKKMHTGRSRNDQVATDIRLYVKGEVGNLKVLIKYWVDQLLEISEAIGTTMLPGYTHLQKAQPILLGYHLNAYVHMFKRDYERLEDLMKRVLVLPLGSGALAGTNYESDRLMVQELLGFESYSMNGLDAVSDRDFIIELQSALSIMMMHFSRLSEELILWQTEAMGFVTISDAFSTGSSLMPQKKNPDACELVRGKTGRVFGSLMNILTVMKGLPLAYNKDMQEDKEGLFDSIDTVKLTLKVFTLMIAEVEFHSDKMMESVENSFLNATELADYLVLKGLPFREAHHLTGEIVKYCIESSIYLLDLDLDIYKGYSPLVGDDVYNYLKFDVAIKNKKSPGSTSYDEVLKDTKALKAWVSTL